MPNFTLQQTLTLYDYTVEIYSLDNESIDQYAVSVLVSGLNDTSMPNDIVNILTNVSGVSKIRILDQDNNLILNSEKYLL